MELRERIECLLKLRKFIEEGGDELSLAVQKAYQHNKWFTPENIHLSLKNISEQFLDEAKLNAWLSKYDLEKSGSKTIGLVMAGNIPLVGFHDFLSVFISGHRVTMKLSSKDNILFPYLLTKMTAASPQVKEWISVTEVLKGMDAIIATGSNNSARYFEYYFSKYPHIIRKNRNAVAVLKGSETKEDLENLGIDIFSYFGLGCRNVSKMMIPTGYDFNFFFQSIDKFASLNEHNKYKNNYDYDRAILLLNKTPHFANDFLILKEEMQVASPVAMLHYEFYDGENDLQEKLKRDKENIQCIIGKDFILFGQSQAPELCDYADDVDTMKFLTELN